MTESDLDYVRNNLQRTTEKASSEVGQAPTLPWIVAYYRNGRGNFIHATRYLYEEVGHIHREGATK